MPELGTPVAAKTTAEFGGYVFPLPEVNPVTMSHKLEDLLDVTFIALAALNDPKVNAVLSAFGMQISDNNKKPLFPRSDT